MHSNVWSNFAVRSAVAGALAASVAGCNLGTPSPLPQGDPNATLQPGHLVGGGTKAMAVDAPPAPGFLPQPDLLTAGGQGQAALVYYNPSVNLSHYDKILMDPVSIWAAPGSDLDGVPADQQRALANAAYSDIYHALAQSCQMVEVASPGTLHFHFALVDAKIPNAVLNSVATYAPYGVSTAYSVASFAFNKGVGYFSGTATGEGFATDAASGTLVWEAVDKRGGTTALVANTLDNWRDVRHAFEAWGTLLRDRLQNLGVCRS